VSGLVHMRRLKEWRRLLGALPYPDAVRSGFVSGADQ
jgi:hypothetical protein